MTNEPLRGRIYTHFKGGKYKVIAVPRDCENPSERSVTYIQLYDSEEYPAGTEWQRDLSFFMGMKKLESGKRVKRFKLERFILPKSFTKNKANLSS